MKSERAGSRRRTTLLIAAGGTALVAAIFFVRPPEQDPAGPQPGAEPDRPTRAVSNAAPPLSETPHLNATGGSMVGSAACRECHAEQAAAFGRTPHAAALALVDPASEPKQKDLYHKLSGRRYRVYQKNGSVRHREWIKTESGDDLVLADHVIKYLIGSGAHSRSYLYESDGFLMESPITWYAATGEWGMSPGYQEDPQQPGFAREARFNCVYCHSGSVEPLEGSTHRLAIHEMSVSCERCHGPGSLHAMRHQDGGGQSEGKAKTESESQNEAATENAKGRPEADGADLTIVHPGRLSRERLDAVCSQCHLASVAVVDVRGRDENDFRPGLRLTDFQIPYKLKSAASSMTVVGHVEQMMRSRCYLESDSMTCVSCHNPHRPVAEHERVQYYRDKCLSCHSEESCGIEPSVRTKQSPQDNCMTCHMPTSETDIPHFAFTHHRIGVHDPETADPGEYVIDVFSELEPLQDISHLPEIDKTRGLGLANLQVAQQASPAVADRYRQRALTLLREVRDRGLEDADVEVALAQLYWRKDPAKTIEHSKNALEADYVRPVARRDALATLSGTYFDLGRYAEAIPILERRVKVLRSAEAWMLLAISLQREGQSQRAIAAATKAAEIEPDRIDLQQMLVELYTVSRQPEKAEEHRRRAKALQRVQPGTG